MPKTPSKKSSTKKPPAKGKGKAGAKKGAKKTNSAKSKTTRKKTTKKSPKKESKFLYIWSLVKPFFIFFVGLGMVSFVLWIAWLDNEVRQKFEGKRWSVPAKVYARPLELYEGQELRARDLLAELRRLRYREVHEFPPRKSGSFSYQGLGKSHASFWLKTRGFEFSDGASSSQILKVEIKNKQVVSLSEVIGRLEPQLIGGIFPAHNEDRVLIQLEETPEFFIETLVLVEDREFFNHYGLSPKAIARAFIINIKSGRVRQGGSTLTQQLVKNFYLSNEQSFARKIPEAFMALLLERHYSKNEILEAYLNEVYMGQAGRRAVHGFGLASQHYFGEEFRHLELHQVALLVAIANGPSYFNPRRNPERALKKRNLIISLMAQNGFISDAQADNYSAKSFDLSDGSVLRHKQYPAFLDLVKRQLKDSYSLEDLQSEGLRVFTGFDPIAQEKAEQSMSETLGLLRTQGSPELQGAMLVVSPQTSEVLALVAGADSQSAGFNRVLDARRSVGSLLKPAIYMTALKRDDLNWASRLDDSLIFVDKHGQVLNGLEPELETQAELDDELWSPRNFDNKVHGEDGKVSMIEAFSKSYNQSTVRLGMQVGVYEVIKSLRSLGITQDIEAYPSLFLGALELSPFQVTQMYQTIANGGFNTPIQSIREVQGANGELLKRFPYQVKQVVDSDLAYLVHAGLQDVMKQGTGRSAYRYIDRDMFLAGKTGTSNDFRDSWFVGYTGDVLASVWLGNDDNSETAFTGSSGALKVWTHFAINYPMLPGRSHAPEGVEWHWIDVQNQGLSKESCDSAIYVPLRRAHVPEHSSECGKFSAPKIVPKKIKRWFNFGD